MEEKKKSTVRMCQRIDTTENWANSTLTAKEGEVFFCKSDDGIVMKVGAEGQQIDECPDLKIMTWGSFDPEE